MLKSYVLIAWRNFSKHRLITIINILGSSIGITAAVIIYLVISYNFSFDTYEPGRDYIYRVVTENTTWKNHGVPAPLHRGLEGITGIANSAPIFDFYAGDTKVGIPQPSGKADRTIKNQGSIVFTNSDYFRIFPRQWLAGDPKGQLEKPNNVVLTQSRAKIYFPDIPYDETLGRTLIFSDSVYATVSGVVKDLDVNSDFDYGVFLSAATIGSAHLKENYHWDSWGATSSQSQLMIRIFPNENPQDIERQLAHLTAVHLGPKDDPHTARRLQPLSDIHTNTDFSGKISKSAMGSLLLLAMFILALGCINFINLATAQGTQRAKEIGIRKTFGGSKRQLVFQFLTETFMLMAITTFIAFTLVYTGIRYFIPGEADMNKIIHAPSLIVFFICLTTTISLLSGLYPAFVLSSFQPIRVLKNLPVSSAGVSQSAALRKVLTVSQFTIAQIFLIGVFVVNKQVRYALEKDMGFRRNAIISVPLSASTSNAYARKMLFRDELKSIPGIEQISIARLSPAFNGQVSDKVTYIREHKSLELGTDVRSGDANFLKVYDIHLIAGRTLKTTDTATELVINETLTHQLGFTTPSDALGQYLQLNGRNLPVVGVMADFNQASVRTGIHPLVLYSSVGADFTMHISLRPVSSSWKSTLSAIQSKWKDIYPDEDFSYTFIDEAIARFYKQDSALSAILLFAAGIAIFVSCIGLLGLAIFSINSRVKEIGIRKILGASINRIIVSLMKTFFKPLTLAFLIAVPLSALLCHFYLQNFAYHTNLSWWVFALSGLATATIAMMTVAYHTIRAAVSSPVDSLHNE
jgi:ABC-type antimicrobial peptide transport system permease subunit